MPSDPRVTRALALLAQPIEQYRAAVATTLEEVRGLLSAGRSDAESRAEKLKEQLGAFASGRIDTSRLSTLLGNRDALDAASLARLERASESLRGIVSSGADTFHVTVDPTVGLAAGVAGQLAVIGRAFAAARVAAAARSGAASGLDEAAALRSFPFGEWTAAERKLAPPLVVSVNGIDLSAGSLAPFLDGGLKLLILVDGPCAPAPLVRLITPSVLVIQAHDLKEVELMANWPATAVAALVPDTAARFVHDPSGGSAPWQRLTVQPPAETRVARVGGLTPAQQNEELHQLEALAAHPQAQPRDAATGVPTAASADPVDRLAAWLLKQASLAGE